MSSRLSSRFLSARGVNLEKLDEQIDFELDRIPPIVSNSNVGQLYLSQELMKVLDQAAKIAAQQKDEFVSCEHLLLALLGRRGQREKRFGKVRRAARDGRSGCWRSCAAPCA